MRSLAPLVALPLVDPVRLGVAALVALAISCLGAVPGQAHGADLKAYLSFEPASLVPGSYGVTLQLLDFYDNPVSLATVRAEVRDWTQATLATANLLGSRPGRYAGEVTFPQSGAMEVHVQAVLSDGPWRGVVKLVVGEGKRMDRPIGMALRHADAPLVTPLGLVVSMLTGLVVIGSSVGLTLEMRRYLRTRGAKA